MEKEKFSKKDEKKVRGISKAIGIIAKIAKVFTIIGVVGLGLLMLLIPAFVNKIEYKNNTITVAGQKVVVFDSKEKNDSNIVNINLERKNEEKIKAKLEEFLGEKNKSKAIIYGEIIMIFLTASLVLFVIIFNYLEKLFKNISSEDTPFTMDNFIYLKKIVIALIISFVLGIVSNIVIVLMIDTENSISLNFANIFEILLITSMAYIFKYGAVIQEKSKLRMIGEED